MAQVINEYRLNERINAARSCLRGNWDKHTGIILGDGRQDEGKGDLMQSLFDEGQLRSFIFFTLSYTHPYINTHTCTVCPLSVAVGRAGTGETWTGGKTGGVCIVCPAGSWFMG